MKLNTENRNGMNSIKESLPNKTDLYLTVDNNNGYECLIYNANKDRWKRPGAESYFGSHTIKFWSILPGIPSGN